MGREGSMRARAGAPRRAPARAVGCVDSEAITRGELVGSRRSANSDRLVDVEVAQTDRVGRCSRGHAYATKGVGVEGVVGPVEQVEDVRTQHERPRPGAESLRQAQIELLERRRVSHEGHRTPVYDATRIVADERTADDAPRGAAAVGELARQPAVD